MDKTKSAQRRTELIELIEKVGFFNVNSTDVAKRYGISRQQAWKDLQLIAKNMEPTELPFIRAELDSGHKRMMKQMYNTAMTHENAGIRIQAARAWAEIGRVYVEFMEKFGLKRQVVEKQEVTIKWQEGAGV